MIELASAPDGVTVEAITIAPGADGIVQVAAVDPSAVGTAALVLSTNDPNHPSLSVALDPAASGQSNTSPDDGEPSGGCNAGGGSRGVLFVGFALVALVKRRRG